MQTTTTFRLPSDCSGNGYDIAVAPHKDDLPSCEPDNLTVRSKVYVCGSFCGYIERTFSPSQKVRDLIESTAGNARFEASNPQVKASIGGGYCSLYRWIVSAYFGGRRRAIGNGNNLVIQVGTYIADYKGWDNCPDDLPETAKSIAEYYNSLASARRARVA
ncbi:MAG: hypothetical protein M1608_13770 [Candidatus Omnitrophica bacterium]|nr:hypothetical protein [Candidatus Omnitrophota bacterium]